MKIAFFNATMQHGRDGVTRVMHKTIEGLLDRQHEVIGFATALPPPEQRSIPMHEVPSITLPLQKAYRFAMPGYRSFAQQLHEFHPDILHIHSPCPLGFAAAKYARDFNVPIVATYHTHFPSY